MSSDDVYKKLSQIRDYIADNGHYVTDIEQFGVIDLFRETEVGDCDDRCGVLARRIAEEWFGFKGNLVAAVIPENPDGQRWHMFFEYEGYGIDIRYPHVMPTADMGYIFAYAITPDHECYEVNPAWRKYA